jgi:HEAT repeat protein
LEFFSASDPFIRFAASVAAAAVGITAVLMIYICLLRGLRILEERRRQRFLERWRPLVYEAITGGTVSWPALARREHETFLWFWNQLHETVRGDAKQVLSRLGVEIGLHLTALKFLRSGRMSRQLLGIVTLGNLGMPSFWNEILPKVDDPHVPVSLAAVQALMRLNAERATPELMPRFATREDWPATRVHAMLVEVDHMIVTTAIDAVLPGSDDAAAMRLIEFAAAGDAIALQPAMVNRLKRSQTPSLWANVLRHLHDPDHLEIVRESCAHPVWFVRVQAVNALGRMGGPGDIDRLVVLLTDAEWWVRFRAAEALLKLPFLKRDELERRAAAQSPAARDLIRSVAAKEAA